MEMKPAYRMKSVRLKQEDEWKYSTFLFAIKTAFNANSK